MLLIFPYIFKVYQEGFDVETLFVTVQNEQYMALWFSRVNSSYIWQWKWLKKKKDSFVKKKKNKIEYQVYAWTLKVCFSASELGMIDR